MAEETERQRLERIAGSKVVPYEMKKEARDLAAQNRIYTQAIESGKTEEEANQLVAQSGIGSATPRLDRMAAEQRQLEASRGTQSDLGGFKTYGDKSTFEAKNAVRKLQGLEPLSAPLPANQQFIVDLEKSASFGMESALVGDKAPKGQARAFEAGIRAGYTPEETRKLISDTAARITGVVDQQKEQTTETPKSPAKLPFFEQVYEQFRVPAPTTTTPAAPKSPTPPVVTDTLTTTPQEGSLFFPKVSNNTVVPMELMGSSLFNKKPTEPTSTRPEGFDQGEYDRYRKAGISEKRAEELASTPPLRQLLNKAGRFFTKESTSPLGF
jgi:hypothetical protein